MEIDDTILEKIRKVQGYLKSDNPNEAAVAAAKLTDMLMRYNLTLEDIPGERRKIDPFDNVVEEHNRLDEWRVILSNAIARANLCKVVVSGSNLHWLGRKSNVEVAQYIYETCSNDLLRIADTLWYAIKDLIANDPTIDMMHGRSWKRKFMMGAAEGVKQKLALQTEEWKAQPQTNALITTNNSELQAYTRTQFPNLGSYGHSQVGGNAYGLGVKTGRNVSFRTGVGAGGSHATKMIGRG